MIPVLTTSQMQSIDRLAINKDIAVGFSYMQKAGEGLYDAVAKLGLDNSKDEIAIICGKGNNGGDGYIVGSMLLENGYKVVCYGLCDGEKLSEEARLAFGKYLEKDGKFYLINNIEDVDNLNRFSLIIDALLGTGIRGNPRGLCAELIKKINRSKRPVLSVDTPSGMNNDTGQAGEPSVMAHRTVTMGFPKIGQLFYPGRLLTGGLSVKNLGYPEDIVKRNNSNLFFPDDNDVRLMIPPRIPDGSKFDHGLIFMLCGSRGMSGSASLAAMAALRSGCGMVHCAVVESLMPVLSVKITEPVLHSIKETSEGTPAYTNLDILIEKSSSMQAALVGPGISHVPETCRLVRELVNKLSIPVVLDADGINAFKDSVEELRHHSSDLLITPHAKEWERIFGELPSEPYSKIMAVSEKAEEFGMNVILKGSPTIIADAEGRKFIMPVGNSGMASAGSGDVLAGIVTSFIAQGAKLSDAAVAGVAVHGRSGEIASRELTEYSVIASDLIVYISHSMKEYCRY